MKTKHYKIGQLASLTGLTVDTVRFYENKGLVQASQRSDAGYRLFSADDLARLQFIKRAKAVGFTLDEISELLELRLHPDDHTCEEVKQVTARKVRELDAKIAELERIKRSLVRLHEACGGTSQSTRQCSILQLLETDDLL